MHTTMLSKFCDRVLEMGWLLAVIVTPLLFNVRSSRVFEPDKLTTLRTVALIMAVVWLVKVIEEQAQGRSGVGFSWQTPLVAPTLFLVASYVVSSVLSVSPRLSFFGSYARLEGTYTTLAYVVVFFVILQGLRTRAQLERLLTVIILNSLPIALYGIVQRSQLDPLTWGGDVTRRVVANMGNPIFVAAYLIMVAPPTLSRAVDGFRGVLTDETARKGDGLRAAVYVFIFVVQLMAIWYTQSRGPLMGLGAGLAVWAVLGFLGLQRVLSRRVWRAIWIGTLVTVVLVTVVFFLINPGGPLHDWARGTRASRVARVLEYESGTGMVRNLIWQGALELSLSRRALWYPPTETHPEGRSDPFNLLRPVVGHGPESMRVAYNAYYPPLLGHYESRTAATDRSHNETWDAMVTRGVLGLVGHLWLFGAVFGSGLRAMGLLGGDWRRGTFVGLLAGGAMLASVAIAPTIGAHFIGLAIPIGMVGGLFLYLVVWGFSRWGSEREEQLHQRYLLLMGLFSAIVAFFVETSFGIAVAATNTTFWCFAGLLVVTGAGVLEEEEVAETPAPRRSRTGRNRLPAWLRPTLASAVVGGFILGTLAFDFVVDTERLAQATQLVWRALTVLPAQGGRTSYGALMIFVSTWVLSAVLFITQMAKRGALDDGKGNWLIAGVVYTLVSFTIGTSFALIVAGRHVAVATARPETEEAVLEVSRSLAGTMTLYYGLILFTLLAGGAVLLIGTGSAPNAMGGVGAAALLVAGLLAGVAAVTTNLRPVQADVIFKHGKPYERADQWPVAIRHHQRATELAPWEDMYHLRLGRAYLEYAKTLPDPAQRQTALKEAERTLERAREINPLNKDHSANLARMYSARADLAEDSEMRKEMIARAVYSYYIATRLSPQDAMLWNERAALYLMIGEFGRAQETISHSLEMDPGFEETWKLQADIYAHQDQMDDALEAFERSLQIAPRQAEVWLQVGDIHRGEERREAAIAAYREALALEPEADTAWDTHRRLALLYSEVGQTDAAVAHAESALAGAPEESRGRLQQLVEELAASE